MLALLPLLIPRNCKQIVKGVEMKSENNPEPVEGSRWQQRDSAHLFENVIKARPLTRVFIPTFIHQRETLGRSFIDRNDRPAERGRLLQTLHDL